MLMLPLQLPPCHDYLSGPFPDSPVDSWEPARLESLKLNSCEITLTWQDARPFIEIDGKATCSVKKAVKKIMLISKKEELVENTNDILNKIALIINHLCNVEAQLYNYVQDSARLQHQPLSFGAKEQAVPHGTPLNKESILESKCSWSAEASLIFNAIQNGKIYEASLCTLSDAKILYKLSK
jgi:hypothetical protein